MLIKVIIKLFFLRLVIRITVPINSEDVCYALVLAEVQRFISIVYVTKVQPLNDVTHFVWPQRISILQKNQQLMNFNNTFKKTTNDSITTVHFVQVLNFIIKLNFIRQ